MGNSHRSGEKDWNLGGGDNRLEVLFLGLISRDKIPDAAVLSGKRAIKSPKNGRRPEVDLGIYMLDEDGYHYAVPCPLCGKRIDSRTPTVVNPCPILNIHDLLYSLHDRMLHEQCVKDNKSIERRMQLYRDEIGRHPCPPPYVCSVTGVEILVEKDCYVFPVFTIDDRVLAEYNLRVFSRKGIREWEGFEAFRSALHHYMRFAWHDMPYTGRLEYFELGDGSEFQGDYFEYVLKQVELIRSSKE